MASQEQISRDEQIWNGTLPGMSESEKEFARQQRLVVEAMGRPRPNPVYSLDRLISELMALRVQHGGDFEVLCKEPDGAVMKVGAVYERHGMIFIADKA